MNTTDVDQKRSIEEIPRSSPQNVYLLRLEVELMVLLEVDRDNGLFAFKPK